MQDLCVHVVSVRTGGAFGARPPLRIPYVACIFVEMYFLALSMCRINQ